MRPTHPWIAGPLIGAALLSTPFAAADTARAVEGSGGPLLVACRAEGAGTSLPEGICKLFQRRLAEARPDREVMLDDSDPALTLVVTRAAEQHFAARLDREEAQGRVLAMARADATLDLKALASFLDRLIEAETPE